jgi:hypothetical protein
MEGKVESQEFEVGEAVYVKSDYEKAAGYNALILRTTVPGFDEVSVGFTGTSIPTYASFAESHGHLVPKNYVHKDRRRTQ